FISDNGGPTAQTSSRNTPLRDVKGTVWEGGVRVPFLLQWKGRLPAGKTYDHPVIALDILPTAVAAAGGKLVEGAKLDGVNLLPYLKGEKDHAPHELLFWRFGEQWAVRKGNWKLTKIAKQPPHLSDLEADIGQQTDLAAQKADVVKELTAAYQKWNAELAAPLWKAKEGMKAKKDKKDADEASLFPAARSLRLPAAGFTDDLREAGGNSSHYGAFFIVPGGSTRCNDCRLHHSWARSGLYAGFRCGIWALTS